MFTASHIRTLLVTLLLLIASVYSAGSAGSVSAAPLCPPDPDPPLVIALFTGFSGSSGDNIGMDAIKKELIDSGCVTKANVERFGHSQHASATAWIKARLAANPGAEIVLVGHSWGADTAIEVADDYLNPMGLTVHRLVQIDSKGVGDEVKPGNVTTGLNIWQQATGLFEIQGAKNVKGSTNVQAETHLGGCRHGHNAYGCRQ